MRASARRSAGATRAASEKNTHTRVTSVSSRRISARGSPSNGTAAPSRTPTATKMIGAVRSALSSRAERAPQPKIAAATTTTARVVMVAVDAGVAHPDVTRRGYARPRGPGDRGPIHSRGKGAATALGYGRSRVRIPAALRRAPSRRGGVMTATGPAASRGSVAVPGTHPRRARRWR